MDAGDGFDGMVWVELVDVNGFELLLVEEDAGATGIVGEPGCAGTKNGEYSEDGDVGNSLGGSGGGGGVTLGGERMATRGGGEGEGGGGEREEGS